MARVGITYDKVANAATAIESRGIEPTITSVRLELGNEGSYSTISQHLAKWRDSKIGQEEASPMPQEAENAALIAITTIWNISQKEGKKEIAMIKQETEDEKKVFKAREAESLAEITSLEGELERLTSELAKSKDENLGLIKNLSKLEGKLEENERNHSKELAELKEKLAAKTTPPVVKKAENTKSEPLKQ